MRLNIVDSLLQLTFLGIEHVDDCSLNDNASVAWNCFFISFALMSISCHAIFLSGVVDHRGEQLRE